jgi:hypothetical protein
MFLKRFGIYFQDADVKGKGLKSSKGVVGSSPA